MKNDNKPACMDTGSMRCEEEGWIQLALPDDRRGLWIRITATALELCAGREGDDDYARFAYAWSMDMESDNIRAALELPSEETE